MTLCSSLCTSDHSRGSVAAARTGRRGVGYDTDADYVAIANARAASDEAKPLDDDDRYRRALAAGKAVSAIAESVLEEAGFVFEGRNVRLKGTGIAADLVVKDRQTAFLVPESRQEIEEIA